MMVASAPNRPTHPPTLRSCPLPDIGGKQCRSGPRSRPKLTPRRSLVLLRCHPQRQSEPRVCPPGVAARQKGPHFDAPQPLRPEVNTNSPRALAEAWFKSYTLCIVEAVAKRDLFPFISDS